MTDFFVVAHTIAVELVVGSLVFAALCIIFRPIASYFHARAEGNGRGIIARWAKFTAEITDPAAYAATIFGVFALIVAAITGSLSWPYDALAANPIIHNKVFFSAVALVTWIWIAIVRWRVGPDLWKDSKLTLAYVGLATFGLVNVALTGAVGGHITGKGSALDALLKDFNFNSDETFALPTSISLALAVTGLALVGYAVWMYRSARSGRPSASFIEAAEAKK